MDTLVPNYGNFVSIGAQILISLCITHRHLSYRIINDYYACTGFLHLVFFLLLLGWFLLYQAMSFPFHKVTGTDSRESWHCVHIPAGNNQAAIDFHPFFQNKYSYITLQGWGRQCYELWYDQNERSSESCNRHRLFRWPQQTKRIRPFSAVAGDSPPHHRPSKDTEYISNSRVLIPDIHLLNANSRDICWEGCNGGRYGSCCGGTFNGDEPVRTIWHNISILCFAINYALDWTYNYYFILFLSPMNRE